MEQETKKTRKSSAKVPYRFYIFGILILVLLGGGGYYGYTYWQASQNSPDAQAAAAEEEKQAVLTQLKKLMILPEGDPVLFKVSNEEVMRKQQAFFKDSKNDDILLVFQESGKAIIFRPSENKIVNSGPVNFDQNAASTTSANANK
jgi:hypothetical protein